jgi:uroporphyrinogen-III synthase
MLLAQSLKHGDSVLHLAGENIARNLGELLHPVGVQVERVALYRVRAAKALGAAGEGLRSGAIDAVLHFSPRSAATFVALAEQAGAADAVRGIRHLCLSAAVTVPLDAAGARTEVASRPEEEALIALLES